MTEPSSVTLFSTCLVDLAYPEVAGAVIRLLEHFRFRVDYPTQQVCCGQPFFNSGFIPQAKKLARQTIQALEDAQVVVVPSGSCTAMIRKVYPELLVDDRRFKPKADALAAKILELSEFLVSRDLHFEELPKHSNQVVTYHDSCHMCRHLGVREQPRQLLRAAGYQVVEMEESDRCCGFGGLFFVQMPEISSAMSAEKLHQAQATGAPVLVTSDPGCLMKLRLESRGEVAVLHLAEALVGEEPLCR